MIMQLQLCRFIVNRVFSNISKCTMCTVSNSHTLENDRMIKHDRNWKEALHKTMQVYPDFITLDEEKSLMDELEPYMKRLRYEFSHWDNAIHGYRETERSHWNEENKKVIDRVRKKAFPKGMSQLVLVHVLDLTPDGWIKPHVDSVRFCGEIIAGLSLLSDSIMRLTMVDSEKECKEDFFLPRRSLYIMSGVARYNYNHEILKSEESYYQGKKVLKERRVSVICRCEPESTAD